MKRFIIYCICLIAALGCAPYGFKFIYLFNIKNEFITLFFGSLFAFCSVFSNAILGAYCFLSAPLFKNWQSIFVFLFSLLAAIPTGFLCYYGYRYTLQSSVIIGLSCIVMLINAFISNAAIYQLFTTLFSVPKKMNGKSLTFILLGTLFGILVSTIIFLTTFRGVLDILLKYHMPHAIIVSIELSVLSWLPLACLYINANQLIFIKLHQLLFHRKKVIFHFTVRSSIALLLAVCSGASLAEIANEAILYLKSYPALMNLFSLNIFTIQPLQATFIVLSFISSAAVNYIALKQIGFYR